jgi:glutamate--cysteine ligase
MPTRTRTIDASDVRRYIAERSFASPADRVGVEIEWLTYPAGDPTSHASFDDVRAAVANAEPLQSRVTFEPGGQVELSTPPSPSIAEACATVHADATAIRRTLDAKGVALHGIGLEPQRPHQRVLHTPRYAAMERYFDAGGPAGRRMMCRTAAIQVNVDAGAQPDVRWRLAQRLGPVLAAAFANSPFLEGRAAPWRSARLATWWAMDRTRTAPVGDDEPAERAWERYMLEANVMLIRAGEDRYEPVMETLPFERWLAEGHRLGWPSIEDLEYHLTTLFPPIRPRGWVELRMIDALPDPWWRAAVAVPVALLYDATASARAWEATRPVGDRWMEALTDGPHDTVLGPAVVECFRAALDALPRLNIDAATIDATREFARRYALAGRCPADDLLDGYAQHGTLPPFATIPAPTR